MPSLESRWLRPALNPLSRETADERMAHFGINRPLLRKSRVPKWTPGHAPEDLSTGQPRQYALLWTKAYCLGGIHGTTPAEDVTNTELAILQVLWDQGETTRRQVADVVYPGGSEAHYATVQNLLGRLERKGFVRSNRDGNVLVFTATVDREELIRRRLQSLADQLCGGAAAPLIMNLVRSQPLSAVEVEQLSTFLREQRRRLKAGGH